MSTTPFDRADNIQLVIDELQVRPHTMKTIMVDQFHNKTLKLIFYRKIKSFIKWGKVLRLSNFGNRFSKTVYYVMPKKYQIIIVGNRSGSEVYYFYEHTRLDATRISVPVCWKLNNEEWIFIDTPQIFSEGTVLRWI